MRRWGGQAKPVWYSNGFYSTGFLGGIITGKMTPLPPGVAQIVARGVARFSARYALEEQLDDGFYRQ